jgi:hypothetical protein
MARQSYLKRITRSDRIFGAICPPRRVFKLPSHFPAVPADVSPIAAADSNWRNVERSLDAAETSVRVTQSVSGAASQPAGSRLVETPAPTSLNQSLELAPRGSTVARPAIKSVEPAMSRTQLSVEMPGTGLNPGSLDGADTSVRTHSGRGAGSQPAAPRLVGTPGFLAPKPDPPMMAPVRGQKKSKVDSDRSVHIGKIEVRVSQPPPPQPRTTSRVPARPTTPLSRGLTSCLGLIQV